MYNLLTQESFLPRYLEFYMSFSSLSFIPVEFTAFQLNQAAEVQLDPVDQISDDFGIPEIKDVFNKILAKGDSFQNAHHRTTIHDFAKASAHKMREYLQQLKGLGKTPEEICKAGRSFLAVIEKSSMRMIEDFETYQVSSIRLGTAYAQFDANVASSTDVFTSSGPVFSATQGNGSLFSNTIVQYRINPTGEQPFVLESVAAKVEKLGNKTVESPTVGIAFSTTGERQEFLDKLDEMAGVEEISLYVKVATFIPTVVMETGIAGVKEVCSVPIAKETCSSVKNGAREIARYTAEQIPQGVKASVTGFIEHRQEQIAKDVADNIKLGISQENTERYHHNLIDGTIGMVPLLGGRIKKMIPKIPATTASNAVKKKPGSHHKDGVKEHNDGAASASSTTGEPDHFTNRVITKRTKMIPEDIGVNSADFYKNRKLFTHHDHRIDGWMTKKKKDGVLKIVIDDIEVPEGRLGNWLTVMSNFKKIAVANEARVLQWEGEIVNDKLLRVMVKRFGKPSIVEKQRGKQPVEFHVFKIMVESNPNNSVKATKALLNDKVKGAFEAAEMQAKTTTKVSEISQMPIVEKGMNAVIWGGKTAKGALLVHQRNAQDKREPKELEYRNEYAHEQ